MEIPTSPYKIPKNPYERELGSIDPVMYKLIPPSLQSIWPLLKAIYQRTEPKEPKKSPAPEPPGEYMTTDEVAAYIKRSPNTIRLWCRQNVIPFIVLPGGDRIFSKEMVRKWLAERAFNVPEP
jgi:excisionase family DNA binding protein